MLKKNLLQLILFLAPKWDNLHLSLQSVSGPTSLVPRAPPQGPRACPVWAWQGNSLTFRPSGTPRAACVCVGVCVCVCVWVCVCVCVSEVCVWCGLCCCVCVCVYVLRDRLWRKALRGHELSLTLPALPFSISCSRWAEELTVSSFL